MASCGPPLAVGAGGASKRFARPHQCVTEPLQTGGSGGNYPSFCDFVTYLQRNTPICMQKLHMYIFTFLRWRQTVDRTSGQHADL